MNAQRRRQIALVALVILPVGVHFALMGWRLTQVESVQFSKLDWLVQVAVAAFLVAGLLAIRSQGRGLKLLALMYALLIAFVAGELLLSMVRPPHNPTYPWQPMRRVATVGDDMPGVHGECVFTVNQIGLRGPEVDLDGVDYSILCVGGSTTECGFVTDVKSWPWLVHNALSDALSETVFVGNAGKSGHTALHHHYLLEHYKLAPRFDCIVLLVGVNDLGTGLANRYDQMRGGLPYETFAQPMKANPVFYYHDLSIVKLLRSLRGESVNPDTIIQDAQGEWHRHVRADRQAKLKAQPHTELPADFELMLTRYRTDLIHIVDQCEARQQRLILMTQPTMWRRDLPDDLKALLWQGARANAYTVAPLEQMMQRFNEVVLEVAEARNVECIDLAAALPKDGSIFYDDCHFTIQGCERVAKIVAEHLLSTPPLREKRS